MMDGIKFAHPEMFWLFIILPLMLVWYIFRQKKLYPALTISTGKGVFNAGKTLRQQLRFLIPMLRMLTLSALIVVLARPQSSMSGKSVTTEGIDIVLAIDVSSSMLAEDFKPNRLEAAKKTAEKFVTKRPNDRIGHVIFSAFSYTQCPVTIDHDVVKNLLREIKSGMIEDGTAIGLGLGTAINRLKSSNAKSKVVILLTDGVNNSGSMAPLDAADIASTYGIRVYTIGVGSRGQAPYPQKVRTWSGQVITRYVNMDVEIDEDVLKQIAGRTDGKYFRATNNKGLEEIYEEIDNMEKTKIDVSFYSRYSEEFMPFAIAGLILFILELTLRYTIFRTMP